VECKNLELRRQIGKFEKGNAKEQGVGEVRWKGHGEIRSGEYTVYYSRGEWDEIFVAIVHKSVVTSVIKKIVYDRIIAIKLQAESIIILIMQVYMPTSEHEDEVEELYDIIKEILEEVGEGDTNTIIMGDWNSVGDESYRNIFGLHDLGRQNHRGQRQNPRGQMLINFCEKNGLIVTNTYFRKPKRRL
jgi:exonuclease III